MSRNKIETTAEYSEKKSLAGLSTREAARKVLQATGKPMSMHDLVSAMFTDGYRSKKNPHFSYKAKRAVYQVLYATPDVFCCTNGLWTLVPDKVKPAAACDEPAKCPHGLRNICRNLESRLSVVLGSLDHCLAELGGSGGDGDSNPDNSPVQESCLLTTLGECDSLIASIENRVLLLGKFIGE